MAPKLKLPAPLLVFDIERHARTLGRRDSTGRMMQAETEHLIATAPDGRRWRHRGVGGEVTREWRSHDGARWGVCDDPLPRQTVRLEADAWERGERAWEPADWEPLAPVPGSQAWCISEHLA